MTTNSPAIFNQMYPKFTDEYFPMTLNVNYKKSMLDLKYSFAYN